MEIGPSESRHPLYAEVGRLLRARRKELRLLQQSVARRTGMGRTSLTNIERGVHRPSLLDMVNLCAVLQLDPGDVLKQAWESAFTTAEAAAGTGVE